MNVTVAVALTLAIPGALFAQRPQHSFVNRTSQGFQAARSVNPDAVAGSISLVSLTNPIVFGAPVTLVATVTPSTANGGRVTFYDGATIIGSSILFNGKANIVTSLLPAGTRSLKAFYGGDAVVGPATTAAISETVNTLPVSAYPFALPLRADNVPVGVTVADVNGDGRADIIAANYSTGTVSVFLGGGNGSFQTGLSSLAGTNPYAIAVGDFNGDGRLDLAVANFNGNNNISVLLGNGNGTFQTPVTYSTASGPRAIAAADLNGDGKADLIVANSAAGEVSVLLGNGDGTFQQPSFYNVSLGVDLTCLVVGDVTGDGKLDVVVSDDSDGSIWILAGNGDGSLQNGVAHASGGAGPRAVVIGDFNADGKPDLAVANFNDNSITILLANASGNFQPPVRYPLSASPVALAIGDFNGDGVSDLAVANGSNFSVLLGVGNGTFLAAVDYSGGGIINPGALNSLALAEFNGDGVIDIVASNNNMVDVLMGTPSLLTVLTLTPSANPSNYGQALTLTASLSSPATTGTVTFFDGASVLGSASPVNGQATLAISTLSFGAHSLKATYSGDATFAASAGSLNETIAGPLPAVTLASSANPATLGQNVTLTANITPASAFGNVTFYDGGSVLGVRPIVAGQANLLTSQLGAGSHRLKAFYAFSAVGVTPPSAAGSLTQTVNALPSTGFPPAFTYGVGALPSAIVAADFTGTGRTGLAVANSGNSTVGVLLSNGDGTFRSAVNYTVGTNPIALAAGDFNMDGKVDLVVVNSGNNNVNLLRANGDGSFLVFSALSTGADPSSVVVADFNGDGKPDIAIANQGEGNVMIYLGNGDLTFQLLGRFPTGGSSPLSMAAGDFNGDGATDLVVTNLVQACSNCSPIPYVTTLLGNGNGTFLPAQVNYGPGCSTQSGCAVVAGYKPAMVVAGDFNADGKLDIAIADPSVNGVIVFLGNGNGTFAGSSVNGGSSSPVSLATGDFNGDGKLDLAVPGQSGNNVGLLLGNGDGTFRAGASFPTGGQPSAIAVSDFNQDGRADLAVANFATNNLSIFLGLTAPSLRFASQPVDVLGGVPLTSIIVQVLDAGGNVDTTSSASITITSVPVGISVTGNAVKGVATFNTLIFGAGGTYTLLASSVGYNSVNSNSFVVTTVPLVAIDTPQPLAIITSGSTMVTGWALESTAGIGTTISSVQVKLDGVVVGSATYGLARPDACVAYPGRAGCPNVGYSFLLNTSNLSTGLHIVTVAATDSASVPATGSMSVGIEVTQLSLTGTRAGIYRANVGFQEDSNGNGVGPNPTDPADHTLTFAPPGGVLAGDLPVVGDWTGDGHTKAGFYRPSKGTWWLDANNDGVFNAGDLTYNFGGLPGDLPVVGDWNGVAGISVHKSCIGIYRAQGSFWLLDLNCNGVFEDTPTDAFFPFGGIAGDVPVVGIWTPGSLSQVGVVRKYAPNGVPQGSPFYWVLDASAANAGNFPVNHPAAAGAFPFGGLAGDLFVTGDWNNTGISRAGVYRAGVWILDVNGAHTPDLIFPYGGLSTDVPLPGKW